MSDAARPKQLGGNSIVIDISEAKQGRESSFMHGRWEEFCAQAWHKLVRQRPQESTCALAPIMEAATITAASRERPPLHVMLKLSERGGRRLSRSSFEMPAVWIIIVNNRASLDDDRSRNMPWNARGATTGGCDDGDALPRLTMRG